MNRKEALEFLELPDNSTDEKVNTRLVDKLNYFTQLSENAPNDFLRTLHLKNIDKIKTIKSMFSGQVNMPVQNNDTAPSYNHHSTSDNSATIAIRYESEAIKPPTAKKSTPMAVALLVRHTENQPTKTYHLFAGENILGRSSQQGNGKNTIVIDDQYVSRVHAVLQVSGNQITIADDAVSNGSKASKNGTYVNSNDDRIKKPTRLKEGDTIQIGMTKFILRLNNATIEKIEHEVEETNYMKTVVIDIF